MLEALVSPWPWHLAGPIIGLMVPLMLWLGSRSFGISQNLEHMVAITQPSGIDVHFFKYDWPVPPGKDGKQRVVEQRFDA